MSIELVPVIEVRCEDQGLELPVKQPFWENPEVWDHYYAESFKRAGFEDELVPYLKGSSLCKLSAILDVNLKKIVIRETQELRDRKYERIETSAFIGGYVLRVDALDKYYPQCCGELSDIGYWENLSKGKRSYFDGHPAPVVEFENAKIIFDLTADEFDEPYQPPPGDTLFSVDMDELAEAVEEAKAQLRLFEQRLNRINEEEKLMIESIGDLLIWRNNKYE
jgi:hypothetical protein